MNNPGTTIESESFRIIREELGKTFFSEKELKIVVRVIHATGDFEYAENLRISPSAISSGITALRGGCQIFTDVNMVKVGITKRFLSDADERVVCLVDSEEVREYAHRHSITRSAAEMIMQKDRLNDAVVAIGNAPTALIEIVRLFNDEAIRPALVIGTPVGFVNAAESKQLLWESGLPCITALGRKGGSSVAAAIVNAINAISMEREK